MRRGNPKTVFFIVFGTTLLVKLWFAYTVPITGDEALFYWWGTFLNWGYYDHPPMVGWMIGLLKPLGESPLILRLPTVLTTFVIALGIADLVGRLNPAAAGKKWFVATVYLLIPITWFGVPVTNDTPLMLFACMSMYCFIRGEMPHARPGNWGGWTSRGRWVWFLFSGLSLGAAFLSKYLAVLLAIAFISVSVVNCTRRRATVFTELQKLALIFLAALPFVLINVFYNANNCWNNVMFNAINRHEGTHLGVKNLGLYILMMVYLLTPWLLVWLWKMRQNASQYPAVSVLALIPFACFLVMAIAKTIGLHWVLAFLPAVFVLAGISLAEHLLRKCLRWTAWFALPHLVLFLTVFGFSKLLLEHTQLLAPAAFVYDAKLLPALAMRGASQNTTLMAEGYSSGAILGYHAQQYVPVFGVGGRYARQDDSEVDFRKYDGQTIRILITKEKPLSEFSPYFDHVQLMPLQVSGRSYWVIHGEGFKYAIYRTQVIAEIFRRYYQIPSILPMYSCPFTERYQLP